MAEPVMKYGARKGRMNTMRRWIAKASGDDIRIFPVPGADLLRLYQAETEMDVLLAANPREANVLLIVGELTDALAQKAGVVYQQIPRPRVLVVAGSPRPPYLPEPDVQVSLDDGFLDEALPQIRQLLQNHAWSENAEPWEPNFLTEIMEDSENGGGHDHHHHDHGNGNDYEGGQDHEEHEHGQEEDDGEQESHDHHGGHNNHEHGDHEDDEDHSNEHSEHDHEESRDHSKHSHDTHEHDHSDHNHEHGGHNHENGGQDHGGMDMDFMSMVAMTKDLPRPKDGLPMNRSEVYFGPFYPGLPGGLSVFMELDGDTVIEASVEGDLLARSFEDILPLDADALPDALARLNPLTPQTYRLLGRKALADTFSDKVKACFSPDEIVLLEKERIASHLNWLATFAKTIGNAWLHQEAARRCAAYRQKKPGDGKLHAFLKRVRSMLYLKTKLTIGGIIPDQLLHHLSGPVAKAAGKEQDARSEDKQYQELDWKPIIKEENSAWGRLLVRLVEIEQSIELIEKAKQQQTEKEALDFSGSGQGSAKIESPRGTLSMHISVEKGTVVKLQVETPSKPLAGLVPVITEEAELSDALVQIASLDIAPSEVQLKGMEE